MKKLSKAIIIYSIIIVSGFSVSMVYHFQSLGIIPTGEYVIGFNVIKETEVKKEKIFDVMADVENYPKILPHNVISIKIINQTQSLPGKIIEIGEPQQVIESYSIFAEETLRESGVVVTQIVKHSIIPYKKHTVFVMSGDAEGTKIVLKFNDEDEKTKITGEVIIRIKGILAPFAQLARSNMESAINTTIDNFIEYSKTN